MTNNGGLPQVKCDDCDWFGDIGDLVEGSCPICCCSSTSEYTDDDYPPSAPGGAQQPGETKIPMKAYALTCTDQNEQITLFVRFYDKKEAAWIDPELVRQGYRISGIKEVEDPRNYRVPKCPECGKPSPNGQRYASICAACAESI